MSKEHTGSTEVSAGPARGHLPLKLSSGRRATLDHTATGSATQGQTGAFRNWRRP